MEKQCEKIKAALIELRDASRSCTKNDQGIRGLMDKYDMIFAGEKISTILTVELAHSLTTKFNIPINHEDLCKMIPMLCDQLGMKYIALYPAEESSKNIFNPDHVTYQIALY